MYTISLAALLIVAAEASASAGYRSSRYSPSYGSYGRSSYGGYSAPKSYGYGHNSGHNSGYGHNSHHAHPDADADATWYTQYQQFRPTKIAFKPVETKAPVYAVCDTTTMAI